MLEILVNWGNPFRSIAIMIDSVAYSLIDNAYNLIVTFSSGSLFNDDVISSVMNNTYIIIGIFALFRIALILVNAMINPDKLNEKGNGLGNVLANLIIMFVILIMTPIIFKEAFSLQETIVKGHYIEKIFLNAGTIEGKNPGNDMKSIAIGSLITINEKAEGSPNCNKTCHDAIDEYNKMKDKNNFEFSTLAKYIGVSVDDKIYVYNYMFIITFVCGIAITYVLLSFGIDIAIRMVELAVLEMLAPLFIATYIDPKSAKSGPFHKWLTTVGKTYASLFIKLAILSLMLLFISLIKNNVNSNLNLNAFEKLVMLFAILIFAKKAPKWIGGMIGVDGEGSGLGGLSIGKKLGGMALAGGLATKGLEKAKQGLGKGARALGGSALGSLGATSAARRIMRDKQKSQGSLKDIYKNARDNGKSKKQALGSYFNEGAKRMKDRAKAGIEGGKYGSREGLQAGANTKNAAEMAGLLGKTYSNMTNEAGHNGIKDKISAKFEDSTANAKIKAFGVSNSEELRKLSENAEKIRKANKYRTEPIKLNSNSEREAFDFQNGIEMNKAIKLACDKGVGFNLDHDPTSANEVYMADMVNNGLVTKVTMDSNGNITSFVDKSGNTISGADVSKALEAYGNSKFTMAGRDQISLDCANNISSTQEALITAKSKVKELEMQSSDLNVNLAKLNMDRSSVVNNTDMTKTMKVALTDSTGKVGNVEMTIADAYKFYQEATDSKVKSEYEDALKKVIPDQFTALESIDTSIMDVINQKRKLDDAAKAWEKEKEERENVLVKICEQFVSSPKDNPMANPDNVTLVGSYEKDSSGNVKFVRNSDKSKVYSVDVARQNTQVKIGKLEEKAKASYNSGKESSESK